MPERHSAVHSQTPGGRPYNSDRQIHYVRRSESKILKRSVDGIVGQNAAPNHAKISNYTTTSQIMEISNLLVGNGPALITSLHYHVSRAPLFSQEMQFKKAHVEKFM